MATALQRQLASIAATSTKELDLKAQRSAHAKSLLYDPEYAASQSFDAIYQTCLEGFEELCALDQRFLRFHRNLFSPQSKNEDRNQMTRHELDQLDPVLNNFLGLVGSRLLLKPGLKALEWLVRRFHVHEYNTQSFILTFLPYHSSPIFTTMLSILPKQLPAPFRFLHSYVNSLTNPPRSVIVYTAVQTPAFFSALNQYVLDVTQSRHQYSSLITFWASIVVQTVDSKLQSSQSGRQNVQQEREEEFLVQLLPTVERALSMKKAPELILGSYMIIVVLAGKSDLQPQVLAALMKAVASSWSFETIDAGLGCIAVLAERADPAHVPQSVIKALLKVDNIAQRLQKIAQEQSINYLLFAILSFILASRDVDVNAEEVARVILQRSLVNSENIARLAAAASQTQLTSPLGQLLLTHTTAEDASQLDVMEVDDEDLSEDQKLKDIEQPEVDDSFPELLSALPEKTSTTSFFLNTDASASLFSNLFTIFQAASSSEARIATFKDLPLFQHDGEKVLLLSFLARAWSSPAEPVATAAFRAALSVLAGVDRKALDFQHLLPYVYLGLGHPQRRVRLVAAEFARELGARAAQLRKIEAPVWGAKTLYGTQSSDIKALSNKTVASIFEHFLSPASEQCVLDGEHIDEVFRSFLDDQIFKSSPHSSSIKSGQRTDTMANFAQHVANQQVPFLRLALLRFANKVDKCHAHPRTKWLLPVLKQYIESGELGDTSSQQTIAGIVPSSDEESLAYLLSSLQDIKGPMPSSWPRTVFERLQHLWPSIKLARKLTLSGRILNIAIDSTSQSIQQACRGMLGGIKIPSEIFVAWLEQLLEKTENTEGTPGKRRRTNTRTAAYSSSAADSATVRQTLPALTLTLELLESSKPKPDLNLAYRLTAVLCLLHSWRSESSGDFGYLLSLTLSSILDILQRLDQEGSPMNLDAAAVHVDIIVDCVCETSNIQARNSGLLLLAILARYIPNAVLQTIMPVFTLMAGSTVRQNDEMSAYVVDQVVQEVIPRLAKNMQGRKTDLHAATREIVNHFASAFDHIPYTRRLRLFTLLADSLGVVDSTFAIIAALVEQPGSNRDAGSFAAQVLKQFGNVEYLETLSRYLDLIIERMMSSQPTSGSELALVGLNDTEAEVLSLLSIVPDLLNNRDIQSQMRRGFRESGQAKSLQALFNNLMEKALKLSKLAATSKASTTSAQTIDGLLKLLPIDEFAHSITPLFERADGELLNPLLRITELQIRSAKTVERHSQVKILSLVPQVVSVLARADMATLKWSAVACLDQICDKFGKADSATTTLIAEAMTSEYCLGSHTDSRVRTLSLHCLASCVATLQENFIPLLQQTTELATQRLDNTIRSKSDAEEHAAAYAFFIAVMDHLPYMMPQTRLLAVLEVSHASAASGLGGEAKQNRIEFMSLLATKLDVKAVCSLVEQSWTSALTNGPQALQEHVTLLKTSIDGHGKTAISQDIQSCFAACKRVLDFRREREAEKLTQLYSGEQTDAIEQQIILTLLSLILKTNDAAFRPFFVQLVEWASEGRYSSSSLRTLTLFNLLYVLSERLKSLVTTYFAYVVDTAVQVLQQSVESNSDPSPSLITLVHGVLRALTSAFKHDQDDFWQSPSRFTVLFPALIVQFTTPLLGKLQQDILSALVELASATSSAENHKEMNSALLKLFRNDVARVRLAAVRCEQALTERLGEEWLGMLPEMLPAISELQEDDDERVERETTRWIKMIEGILGESLDTMLQ